MGISAASVPGAAVDYHVPLSMKKGPWPLERNDMKTLLLIRHAKSSWADPGRPDHDRVLNDRGRRDAPEMGRRLKRRGVTPT